MASEPRTFLWVNKDGQSSSLSSSDSNESSRILSHVQRTSASRRHLRRPPQLAATEDEDRRKSPGQPGTSKICVSPPSEKIYETLQSVGFISPAGLPAGVDPFSVTTMAVSKHSRELLTYHVEWWRAVAPEFKSWHEVDLSQPADVVIAQKCFQNPLYLLSIITFSSVQMESLNFACAQPARSNTLHSKTVSALRKAVCRSDQDPMQLLEILSYMCLTEVFRCDFTAGRMHLSAVKYLLRLVGAISKVLNYASDMFIFSDYYLALSTLAQPVLGHCINFSDTPPIFVQGVAEKSNDIIRKMGWVRNLSHSILGWAVGQLVSCVQILQHSWTDKKFVVNGFWVRKKCVSLIICLLDAWGYDDMPSRLAETARISLVLWSAFLAASTLDTQGARNYIPLFDAGTIKKYRTAEINEVASAQTKWNRALSHDFGQIPLGCDVLLRTLLMVPMEIEEASGIHLRELMNSFCCAEESQRLEKAMKGLHGVAERHHRWRVWRTSILLC
ncbi:hypothetical protein VTL71DRAFT_6206 [Oculimacula yallundae]|uniref:Uncharacterized protein n=1 Tax=Oculimacula yallundae TaxID=86028 RepID=A0ABR4BZR4_9HELO